MSSSLGHPNKLRIIPFVPRDYIIKSNLAAHEEESCDVQSERAIQSERKLKPTMCTDCKYIPP